MAKRDSGRRRQKRISTGWAVVIGILFAAIAVCYVMVLGNRDGVFGGWKRVGTEGDGKTYFHFLDVGQGDATLITSDGGDVVIDVGGVAAREQVSRYIRSQTDTVDYLILTHPHEDHMGAADAVIRTVDVKNVILPDAVAEDAYFARFTEEAEKRDVNVIEAVPGEVYTVGEMTLTILAPLDPTAENLNNVSVVTRVDVGETSVMFTGDAEGEAEEALLAAYDTSVFDCDLYQAGHHGSYTSSTRSFVEAMSPDAAVISCGKNNSYGHPHGEVLNTFGDLGVEVFRTDEEGTILFVTDGAELRPYQK